jgi:hypothetical protein
VSLPNTPYPRAQWPTLTTATIDWSRWPEDDQSLAVRFDLPVSVHLCDAAWQELIVDSRPRWLTTQRHQTTTEWITHTFTSTWFETQAHGVLEFQSRGPQVATVRLWTPSPGPSGASRIAYSAFDTVDPVLFFNLRPSGTPTPAGPSLGQIAATCLDATIAHHVRKKAEVAELKRIVGRWLHHLIHAGHLQLATTGHLLAAQPSSSTYAWPVTDSAVQLLTLVACVVWFISDPGFEPIIGLLIAAAAVLLRWQRRGGRLARALDLVYTLALMALTFYLLWRISNVSLGSIFVPVA